MAGTESDYRKHVLVKDECLMYTGTKLTLLSLREVLIGLESKVSILCRQKAALCDRVMRRDYTYVAIKFEFSDVSNWEVLFGPDLGSIQRVEIEIVRLAFRDGLDTEVPFRVLASLDCGPKILAVEIGVLASQFQGFVPNETMHTKVRCEVELDEVGLPLGIEQLVSVYTESLHHSV